MSTLKKNTIKGLFWSSIERFSVQGLQFILSIVLARLLFPSEYGLIAMITIFLSISQALIDSGFSQALIQKKETVNLDYDTVFCFNLSVSILLYSILFFVAPLIASFYAEPILIVLIRVISLNLIISSFSIIQISRLSRELNFKTLTKSAIFSSFVSGVIAILLAYNSFGVWSLVSQVLVKNSLNALYLLIVTKWKPKLSFNKTSFSELFSYGSNLLFSGLLNSFFNNLYIIVIGKIYKKEELGLYTKANQLQQLPSETIVAILQRVMLPVLSSIQDEEQKLSLSYKNIMKFSCFITFPIMIGSVVTAEPIIYLILGSKWLSIVEYFQLLCFIGLIHPIHAINLNVLKVIGRTDIFLKLEILKKVLVVIALMCTYSYGIEILIIGQVLTSFLCLYINSWYSEKFINYSFIDQIKDLSPILINSVIMGVIIYYSLTIFSAPHLIVSFSILIGIISYFIVSLIFNRKLILEIRNFIQQN